MPISVMGQVYIRKKYKPLILNFGKGVILIDRNSHIQFHINLSYVGKLSGKDYFVLLKSR